VAVIDPLPIVRVADIEPRDPDQSWLIQQLWGRAAVGFLAGAPKSCKSWLALDMAVSVASGTACLCRFECLAGTDRPPTPLTEAVRAALRNANGPQTRTALRSQLAVNNARLGEALNELEARGLAQRGPKGWSLPQPQLALVE